jgi:uncharacterized protein (TIGR02265 family)
MRQALRTSTSKPPGTEFVDPPWQSPLQPEKVIAAIPASAKIAGMFYLALIDGARRRGLTLPLANERYLPFTFYSTAEFARLLVYAAQRFYVDRSLREGLRVIGWSGPKAFAASTLGKVTLGAAEGVHDVVAAIAKTYEINIPPSRCSVVSSTARAMVLSLQRVHHFLDCHHVGVFEGTLQHAGVQGRVRIASRSPSSADLLLEWSPRSR